MIRFVFGLAALVAVLAAPAFAQKRGGPSEPTPEEMEKRQQQQNVDQQYRSTLKRMKQDSAPAYVDPWANTRGTDNRKR